MIKILSIIFFGVAILSCQNSNEKKDFESLGETKSNGEIKQCACDSLVKNNDEKLILKSELFTGVCVINYKNSNQKYIEKQILKGELNGKIIYYDKNGKVLFEENYEKGNHQLNLEIENISCDCKLLEKKVISGESKYFYKNQLFTGTCFDNYPTLDQAYRKSVFKRGFRNGFTTYYDQEGEKLYSEMYEANVLIETIN